MSEDSTACSVTPSEVVDPNSTRGLYEEALAESLTSDRDEAKRLIAGRIQEIQRLEMLLAKAKADLQKLLSKDVTEIAMMNSPVPVNMLTGGLTSHRRLDGGGRFG